MDTDQGLYQKGIEAYTDRRVTDLKVAHDPKVRAVALRAVLDNGEAVEFVLNLDELDDRITASYDGVPRNPAAVADVLSEECFTQWPPFSGKLKFF